MTEKDHPNGYVQRVMITGIYIQVSSLGLHVEGWTKWLTPRSDLRKRLSAQSPPKKKTTLSNLVFFLFFHIFF